MGFLLTVAVYPWHDAIPPEDTARYLAAGLKYADVAPLDHVIDWLNTLPR